MRHHADAILHSPSDLVRYFGCAHATALDLLRLTQPEDAPERNDESDAMGALVQEAGLAHEEDYRSQLAAEGGLVEIPTEGSLQDRAAATIAAMWKGAPAIFQAAFLQSPWHGFADFLVRVEEPSDLGTWSYEPVDTKLARSAKASHIVQLALYARMIGAIQGRQPARVHVQLGSGERESFRMAEFAHVMDAAITRYLAFVDAGARGTTPEPCSACSLCPWLDHCKEVWEAEDRLTRIAGLSVPQAEKLQAAGITTAAALAASPEDLRVPSMALATFAKLRGQARLQVARMAGGDPVVETLPPEPGRGFANLPKPDPADLFFDLEGDPLEEGGLDYLWGVHYRDGSRPIFRHRWGHDHQAERVAFEDTLDWMADHLAANPGAHVYHYAPYEITALRRLSTLHASREETLDNLLRSRRFIDLYGVLRQAIRTSEPNLSLKTMEVFFAEAREGEVTKADQSVVEYKSWQATGDEATLQGILDYNRVDCENTEALRDWLVELRMDDLPWRDLGPPVSVADEKAEARAQAEHHAAQLIAAIEQGSIPADGETRALVGHLTQFHRRADKPAYWAMFDRCEREPEDLVDDGECIGAIEPDPDGDGVWQQPVKRSVEAGYRFPPQETKLREGVRVLHAPSLTPLGTITALDTDRGTLRVKRMLKADEAFPEEGSVIPVPTLDSSVLVAAVHRVAGCWADGGQGEEDGTPRYRALLDILERTGPRFASSSVLHSKRRTRNRREIDIFCEMTMADGSSAAMLIENKLDAMEQADQAESYREELEVLAGRYQQKAMLLVCPKGYRIRHGHFASKFDVVITYEEMAVWLAAAEPESKREASRYQFRRDVIEQAVHKARRGYEPVGNAIIGDFNALYCELLARIAPGIVPGPSMRKEANPDESVSMIFDAAITFADLPTELRPRRFAHELGRGQSHRANYVAVTFSRWGRAFKALRAMFEEQVGNLGANFATKPPSKRTPFPGLTMWVPTPPVDNQAIFSSQISHLTTGIVQAVQLRKWLLDNEATLSRWKDAVEGELRS